jgi:uncharacterized delta-60 repeat protein
LLGLGVLLTGGFLGGCGLLLGVGDERFIDQDAASDSAVVPPDTGFDAAADSSLDAMADSTVDSGGDATVDSAVESGGDATLDGTVDADAGPDTAVSPCSEIVTLAQTQLNLVRTKSNGLVVQLTGDKCASVLEVSGLPSGVSVDSLAIPDGGSAADLTFRATADAGLGPAKVLLSAGDSGAAPLTLLVQDPPGAIDTTFANGGTALFPLPGDFNVTLDGLVLDSDGGILLSGNLATPNGCSGSPCYLLTLIKLDGDGRPDPAFGNAGLSEQKDPADNTNDVPLFTIIAPGTNEIFSVGFLSDPQRHVPLVAAFKASGQPDPKFNAIGFLSWDPGAEAKAYAVTLESGGALVVGGFVGFTGTGFLARASTQGVLDTSFGGVDGGIVLTSGAVNGLGTLSTGAIVAALQGTSPTAPLTVARYSSDGVLDPTYGTGLDASGPMLLASTADTAAMVVQPDDAVVVAGDVILADGTKTGTIGLARFRADGTLDPTFTGGADGGLSFAGTATVHALQRIPDGRFVVGINIVATPGALPSISVARLTSSGELDKSFAGTGFATAGTSQSAFDLRGVGVDAYGRILVAGVTMDPNNSTVIEALVARYWP